MQAVLDLRSVKGNCKKVEHKDLKSQETQDDTFTVNYAATPENGSAHAPGC